jgi:hypothetical protein
MNFSKLDVKQKKMTGNNVFYNMQFIGKMAFCLLRTAVKKLQNSHPVVGEIKHGQSLFHFTLNFFQT